MQPWFHSSPKARKIRKHHRKGQDRRGARRSRFDGVSTALERLEDRVLLVADLAITQISATPPSVAVGSTETYTFAVTNNGPNAAIGPVVFTDTFASPGATAIASDSAGDTLTAAPGLVSGAITPPAVGSTLSVTVAVTPAAPGAIVNTAVVTDLNPLDADNPANNTAGPTITSVTGTATITGTPDLSITKTGPATITLGTTATYTLVATAGTGAVAATGVVVTDLLPPGATGATLGTTATGVTTTVAGGVATATIATLAAGSSDTLTLTATFNAPGPVVNTATIESLAIDPTPADNVSTVSSVVSGTATVTGTPDLSITKTGTPATIGVGGSETYTVVVTAGTGTAAATGVVVTDLLPAGATGITATGPAGVTFNTVGNIATATIGTLAAGTSDTLTLTATLNTPGVAVNVANVTSPPDLTPADNVATATTTVTGTATVTGAPDLSITKTGTPATIGVGGTETYRLVVTAGTGSVAATGVIVTDLLPAGATGATITGVPSGGTSTVAGGVATATIATLAAGSSDTLTITAALNTPGVAVNVANVESPAIDATPADNVSTATTTVTGTATITGAPDLSITKTGTPATVGVGGTETYTLVVTAGTGATAATGVVVSDILPAGATSATVTAPAGVTSTVAGGVATATIATLAAGSSDTLTITATLNAPGVAVNVANVESPAIDATPADNVATATTTVTGTATVTGAPDLSIAKTGTPATIGVGGTETYTLVVTAGTGTTAATGVVVSDILPAGATSATVTAPAGVTSTVAGGVATATIATLAAGSSDTLTITATLNAPGVAVNVANVESPAIDATPADNVATATTTVTGTATVTGAPDLSITKTGTPATIGVGGTETYTLVVTAGTGTTAATGVVVSDILPAGATSATVTAPAGVTSTVAGGVATATIATLAAGSSDTLTITATLNAPGVAVNVANVESPAIDATPADNVSTATTTVTGTSTATVDLAVTKTAAPATGVVGTNEVYTVVVTNNSTTTGATGVRLTDILPANATFVSSSAGTVSAGVLTDIIGNLATGASDTITVTVTPTVPGVIVNTANVEGNETDTNQANNTAIVVTPVQGTGTGTVDVSVTKTPGTNPAVIGGNEVYMIVVTNSANSSTTATGVTLIDTLPTNATFVSSSAGTVTGGTLTDTIGSLAAGASATITLTVKPTSGTTLVNTATVAEDQVDTNYANNSATVSVPISTTTSATLTISKAATPEPVSAGGQLTYTIVVNNTGGAAATGTVFTDTLPAGLTFVSGTDSNGNTVNNSGGTLTDNIGTLAAGATDTITVVTDVGSSLTAGQTIVNTGSVSSPSFNGGTAITASATSTIAGVTPLPGHICYVAGTPGDGTDATFLTNLYRELLGRDPDPIGQAGWTSFLQTGNFGGSDNDRHGRNTSPSQRREEVIQGFMNSQEYRQHLVSCVYENFLGRAPDAGGLAFWTDKLGNPGTEGGARGSRDLKFVVAAIAGSDEFFLHAGGTAQTWVDALYQDILGRAADGDGQQFWMNELNRRGANDRDGIVRDLLNTSEAEHKLLNANFPTAGTPSTLGAPGTSAGGTYALAELTGGGWENLFFNGPYDSAAGNSNVNANDLFFAKLAGNTPWDDVIEDMLETDAYFTNHNQVGTLATGTGSNTGTGG